MDVREKLVELLQNAKSAMKSENLSCDIARNMFVVDFMIANGVTVQEWISVKSRLPENDQWALCFMKDKSFGTFRVFQWNYIDWQWNDGDEWFDEKDVTHWMPTPQPPKGE